MDNEVMYLTPSEIQPAGSAPGAEAQLLSDIQGRRTVHCHLTVGLEDASVRGGHLVEATVSPTLEIIITVEPSILRKRFDACSGLTLFDPSPLK